MKWHPELYFTWGDSSIRRICLAKMSIRPKRTQFCWKMLCFQQLTQLNLVIAVENTPTRASAFNLSDPAVVVNERAVTSRHRNEEYSSNPHPVSGSSVKYSIKSLAYVSSIGNYKKRMVKMCRKQHSRKLVSDGWFRSIKTAYLAFASKSILSE